MDKVNYQKMRILRSQIRKYGRRSTVQKYQTIMVAALVSGSPLKEPLDNLKILNRIIR